MDESCIKRGLRDSLSSIRTWPIAIATTTGAAVGAALGLWLCPESPLAGLIALGAFAGMVLWIVGLVAVNLARAPFRQRDDARRERDVRAAELSSAKEDLAAERSKRPLDAAQIAARQAEAANKLRPK